MASSCSFAEGAKRLGDDGGVTAMKIDVADHDVDVRQHISHPLTRWPRDMQCCSKKDMPRMTEECGRCSPDSTSLRNKYYPLVSLLVSLRQLVWIFRVYVLSMELAREFRPFLVRAHPDVLRSKDRVFGSK